MSKGDADTTLEELKSIIHVYQSERGWDNLPPRDIATSIVLEASELLEHFQWSNQIDVTARREDIVDELADTLIYIMEFALRLDIDIASSLLDKLERIKRKYPVTVFNPSNQDQTAAYQKVKRAYRAGRSAR